MKFYARSVTGAGRGKSLGFPTINLNMDDVPAELEEGVYACTVTVEHSTHAGALHYGPRATFGDVPSCEVYLLHVTLDELPEEVDIEIVKRIRDVMNFGSAEELKEQIEIDIENIQNILKQKEA